MQNERRITNRRKFGYFMRVIDNNTKEIIGYLSDISTRGFQLESQKTLTIHKDYALCLDLTAEIVNKSYINFVARAMWSRPDPINPNEYIHGFQIVAISPYEQEIFQRVMEKYSKPESKWLNDGP
jgi:PilZ domain